MMKERYFKYVSLIAILVVFSMQYIWFSETYQALENDLLVEPRPFPCILHWNQEHFVVLHDVRINTQHRDTLMRHDTQSLHRSSRILPANNTARHVTLQSFASGCQIWKNLFIFQD
jgi:ABC-type bacteriocin/lantibiotic exporter with double-glycine peptidase domain